MKNKLSLKKDTYSKKRGSYSRWLLISCEHCKNRLLLYQKDGPGILKRLYLDRISAPTQLSTLQYETDRKNIPNLECGICKRVIGIPMIFEKENRLAYRLFVGAVEKKIVKENIKVVFNL